MPLIANKIATMKKAFSPTSRRAELSSAPDFIRAPRAYGKILVKLYRDFINAVNQKAVGSITILPLAPIHARNGTIEAAEVISSRAVPPTRPRDDPFVGRLPSLMENPYVVHASAASLFS